MNDALISMVEHLVSERTGLRLRPRQLETLQAKLAPRFAAHKVEDAEAYCRILNDQGPTAEAEWQHLAHLLTNKESYFFRDTGQMALLRDHIFPELISRNKLLQTLKVWSAGCSTGEEAYSLAMLISELGPEFNLENWQIDISGTDIDSRAVKQAQRGIYGSWSFRMVDPATKSRYFAPHNDNWQIKEPLRSSVTFTANNLVVDPCPSLDMGLFEVDLILCRNVFIYFELAAVQKVLDRFACTLRDGGYLMTGHVETRGIAIASLQTRSFKHSEVLQKGATTEERAVKSLPKPRKVMTALPNAEAAETKITVPTNQIETRPIEKEREQALLIEARKLADLGRYIEATECCIAIIRDYPFSAEPYGLLASIAVDQGHLEEAKPHLKKALYLAPEDPKFYIELGALYSREGDEVRSRRMNASALELLRNLPPESSAGFPDGAIVRDYIKYLTEMYGKGA